MEKGQYLDKVVVNGKEYSGDLSEYSEGRGTPPISNPVIPVFSSGITCES